MDVEVRPLRDEDASAVIAAVAASHAHLLPWMPWAREPASSLAAQLAWQRDRSREAAAGGDRTFGVFASGILAGMCGLHRRIGPGGLEIGYWTHVDWVRRGVATAAVRALVVKAFAEPSIGRLEIHHDARNEPSGAVARAAGFTWVCDRPDAEDGQERTERVWRLVRPG